MKTILHRAESRGLAEHGWLTSYHTFSFADYYNPQRMNFGALRVLNDDSVEPGQGFGAHPHDNMEIVSIPLAGELEHKDSVGNAGVIQVGDIQVMSAGTGIVHSEYNPRRDVPVKFLQIWVMTARRNVAPRYAKLSVAQQEKNSLQEVISPCDEKGQAQGGGLGIHQATWFSTGKFDAGQGQAYKLHSPHHGVYSFVLEGKFSIAGQELGRRDGLGLWELDSFEFKALTPDSAILLMEVPMQ